MNPFRSIHMLSFVCSIVVAAVCAPSAGQLQPEEEPEPELTDAYGEFKQKTSIYDRLYIQAGSTWIRAQGAKMMRGSPNSRIQESRGGGTGKVLVAQVWNRSGVDEPSFYTVWGSKRGAGGGGEGGGGQLAKVSEPAWTMDYKDKTPELVLKAEVNTTGGHDDYILARPSLQWEGGPTSGEEYKWGGAITVSLVGKPDGKTHFVKLIDDSIEFEDLTPDAPPGDPESLVKLGAVGGEWVASATLHARGLTSERTTIQVTSSALALPIAVDVSLEQAYFVVDGKRRGMEQKVDVVQTGNTTSAWRDVVAQTAADQAEHRLARVYVRAGEDARVRAWNDDKDSWNAKVTIPRVGWKLQATRRARDGDDKYVELVTSTGYVGARVELSGDAN